MHNGWLVMRDCQAGSSTGKLAGGTSRNTVFRRVVRTSVDREHPSIVAPVPSSARVTRYAVEGGSKRRSSVLELAPAAVAVVVGDMAQHLRQRLPRDGAVPVERDGSRGLVVVPSGDEVMRVGHDGAIVEKQVDVVLGGEQRAHVALQHEVGLNAPLDRLLYVGVRRVD